MGVCCAASAYAIAPSERTFAATAAFTGKAMFALMSDIAARSGSSSPASSASSSRDKLLYSWDFLPMSLLLSDLRFVWWRRVDGVATSRVDREERKRLADHGHHFAVRQRLTVCLGDLFLGHFLRLLLSPRLVPDLPLCHRFSPPLVEPIAQKRCCG